jgi:site-specific DNA-methyltransferase (adenine-specific)
MKTKSEVFNMDCIEAMKQYPDNHFELAIVDPPYGLERLQKGSLRLGGTKGNYENKISWDKKPNEDYFLELFRVSKNQIIWGANNFVLPPTEYFCIWDKKQTVDNFATAEYAWVSMGLKKPAKIFTYSIHQHNQTDKIHPTQKPIKLYQWILKTYAKEGDKILDTHLGSGSSRIAAYDLGFEFTGFELDEDYFKASEKRFKQHTDQLTLF